ncbi:MAG: hypothetical protein NT106_01745 [Candidatus Sumerlaeota bacterium]|nr:hypothetical protein [Candidatus Sumerlaeota bacterium]
MMSYFSGFWSHVIERSGSIFYTDRLNVLLYISAFLLMFLFLLRRARKGKSLFFRQIPGLKALDEAIGRATEMGKPVLYVPGIDDIDEIQTLASLNILPYVAEKTAQYQIPLIVPTRASIVLSIAEEIVRQSYILAGKPEDFNRNNIRYLSDEQFAFTAAVGGIMLREKPATNIYMGSFYSESLVLAETGFASGAIQIAGTATIAQLPFFIAACDYTIIGEEFYAASAYLSREPSLLAGIKAADFLKIFILLILFISFCVAVFNPEFLKYITVMF